MARPKGGYDIDGEKVVGVTTPLNRYKDPGPLIHWAWKQGSEGKDYRETRDAAADAGTCAHDMVECDIYGQAFVPTQYQADTVEKATPAFQAYQKWKQQTQLQVAETELSLLSRTHRFGGTLDALFVQGQLALGDWKTSGGVYAEYLLQLAAYGLLWEENFPDRPLTGGYHLLRFSKSEDPRDPIHFSHHYWSDLTLAKEQFLLLLAAYKNDKRLKGML